MKGETLASCRVAVRTAEDVIVARQEGRTMACQLGFSSTDITLIVTAISELARNIVLYAGAGEIILKPLNQSPRVGIAIVAHDEGPGIADVELALQDGYSTSGGLGLGLPGTRRLMDEFHIVSKVGQGTTVTVKKWKP